jgi:FkbM family methyltransferase
MPSRVARTLLDRRLPTRTRLDLLTAGARRRLAARELYGVRYGRGTVYLSHSDYATDLATFDFAVRETSYATDYRGAVVLDLGAHKGYYAAYAVAHGARAVITYEPESTNLAVLERTAAGYRDDGVSWEIRAAAVDSAAGSADLHVMAGSWGHALDPPHSFAEYEVGVESVPVVALEDALAEAACLHPDARQVVKVNIEGAECSAVLETPPSAWSEVSEAFVETHPWSSCDAESLAAHLAPRASGAPRVRSRPSCACVAEDRLDPIDVPIPCEVALDGLARARPECASVPLVAQHLPQDTLERVGVAGRDDPAVLPVDESVAGRDRARAGDDDGFGEGHRLEEHRRRARVAVLTHGERDDPPTGEAREHVGERQIDLERDVLRRTR